MTIKTPRSEVIECMDSICRLCEAIDGGKVTISELTEIMRIAIKSGRRERMEVSLAMAMIALERCDDEEEDT